MSSSSIRCNVGRVRVKVRGKGESYIKGGDGEEQQMKKER